MRFFFSLFFKLFLHKKKNIYIYLFCAGSLSYISDNQPKHLRKVFGYIAAHFC